MTQKGHSAHNDSRSELSHKDIQVYARQLVSVTITEHLKYGWFDRDLAFFNKEDQKRIVRRLREIARQMNASTGKELPPEKEEEKGQEEV